MKHSRILAVSSICLIIAACNTQEQTAAVIKTTSLNTTAEKLAPEKPAPEKPAAEETGPEKTAEQEPSAMKTGQVLNLSINNMHIDHHGDDNPFLSTGSETSEQDSALFEKLSENKVKSGINFSGKLFTDDDKLENREYLKSVDGVQINIEGNFN